MILTFPDGTRHMTDIRDDPLSKFLAQVDVETSWPCWKWKGDTDGRYGRIWITGRGLVKAHRLSYELFVGPIPDSLVMDHLCRNTWCVSPRHVEPVTQKENVRRGLRPGRKPQAECGRGHPLRGGNLGIRGDGRRYCLLCGRERERERRRRAAEKGIR